MPLYVAILIIFPGLAVAHYIGYGRDRVFLAAIFTLVIFLVNVEIARHIIGFQNLFILYLTESVAGLGVLFLRIHREGWTTRLVLAKIRRFVDGKWVLGSIVGIVTVYVVCVGPYMEVPTDVYSHLGAIQLQQERLESGSPGQVNPWYQLLALANLWGSSSVYDHLQSFTWLASLWFIGSFYLISLEIISQSSRSKLRGKVFGLVSTMLMAILYGTSVFSYLRYYVFAPAFIVLPIFFYLSLLVWRKFEEGTTIQQSLKASVVWVGIGVWLLYEFHRQEALFFVLTVLGLTAYKILGKVRAEKRRRLFSDRNSFLAIFLAVGFVTLLSAIVVASTGLSEGVNPLRNNLVDLGRFLGLPTTLLVADPSGRVFETYGAIGIFVSLFYFFVLRPEERVPVLTVLLLVPIFTLFNPLFVGLFLLKAGQDVLWRISYMAPIGVCAAFVGYRLFERVRSRTALGVWMTCCTYVLVTGTLVLPLSDDNSLRQLRYATLRGVAPSNDYRNWDDLIEELRVFRYRHVLTDPVTGYVITAMTKNRTFGFKFHGSGDFLNPNVPAYGSNSFEDYVGWLLVLNLRNGGYSENGSQSGHWPGDALKTSKFYSAQLVEFLENPPPHIQLIWESDSIKLFEIVDK